jgi:hypothetical protein
MRAGGADLSDPNMTTLAGKAEYVVPEPRLEVMPKSGYGISRYWYIRWKEYCVLVPLIDRM